MSGFLPPLFYEIGSKAVFIIKEKGVRNRKIE